MPIGGLFYDFYRSTAVRKQYVHFQNNKMAELQHAKHSGSRITFNSNLHSRVTFNFKKFVHLGCVRLTVFRNRNTWNTSWKSFVFAEILIKIVKHLLKCYFKHIFIILAASKRAKHTVLIITPRILIPE